ncbi:phospholipid-translocating ATPase [Entomophthora muscae]|uniref:Phospholipid-translocating ATPase n=1 Tax=Entomophthora muscae TaxID=34485 RepID=A0ACC2TTW8_9FUNG|nr:phospholipid-translocating ATPase [Entomophthora muscae]
MDSNVGWLRKYSSSAQRRWNSLFSFHNESSLEEDDDSKTSSFILRSKSYHREDVKRRIFFNLPLPDAKLDNKGLPAQQFKTNLIKTTKYTPITFLPKKSS